MEKNLKAFSAIVYDFDRCSVTHVRLDSGWFSIDDLAVESMVPTEILRKEFAVLLYNRLRESIGESLLRELDEKLKVRLERDKVLKILSKYGDWSEDEVETFMKALFKDDENVDSVYILSLVAGKANVPFRDFVKDVVKVL